MKTGKNGNEKQTNCGLGSTVGFIETDCELIYKHGKIKP